MTDPKQPETASETRPESPPPIVKEPPPLPVLETLLEEPFTVSDYVSAAMGMGS
jgi:hypothetical protein